MLLQVLNNISVNSVHFSMICFNYYYLLLMDICFCVTIAEKIKGANEDIASLRMCVSFKGFVALYVTNAKLSKAAIVNIIDHSKP